MLSFPYILLFLSMPSSTTRFLTNTIIHFIFGGYKITIVTLRCKQTNALNNTQRPHLPLKANVKKTQAI